MPRPKNSIDAASAEYRGQQMAERESNLTACKHAWAQLVPFFPRHQLKPIKNWLGAETAEEALKLHSKVLSRDIGLLRGHIQQQRYDDRDEVLNYLEMLDKAHRAYREKSKSLRLPF